MELTIPPLFRLPHPFRNRRAAQADATVDITVERPKIPAPRTSGERTAEALVQRG